MPVPTSQLVANFWTDDKGPWWGIPVIAGSFLLAVAVVTFGANLILKKMELGRADRSRWDDKILETAIELRRLADEMAAVGNKDNQAYKESILDRIPVYEKSLAGIRPLTIQLGLVASKRLAQAAAHIMTAALHEGLGLHEVQDDESDEERLEREQLGWKVPTLAEATKELNEAVREELRARD